ncbi:MAG: 5'/3'-nucleotidase SurE [Bacteroidota bacterium]
MNILVTNDDGINSNGILALVNALKRLGNVTVIAPDRQQSAVGHAVTVSSPLRATPVFKNDEFFGYAINGTPADCVKLGISTLLKEKPDLVVSGINHGPNLSINVLYSGTVSAATEATMMGYPSIAVSLDTFEEKEDCVVAAEYAAMVAEKVLKTGLPKGTLLNVNVPHLPKEKIKGIKLTKQAQSQWDDSYERRKDPRGGEYFWLTGVYITSNDDPDNDDFCVSEGWVSVTPIHYKMTDHAFLKELQSMEEFSF